jgi:hypothetical protein
MSGRDTDGTTIVNDQALDDCPQTEQARCEECGCPVETIRGHRPRRYCSDSCKQSAYQTRRAQKETEARRARLCATYPDFSEKTIDLLDGFAALDNQKMVGRIATTITAEVEGWQQGLDQVQQCFNAYVAMTNERVGEQVGELAKLRQEQERKTKATSDTKELEQARADLLRLYQERARGQEEIHRLYELAQELQMHLGAARHRIAELEQQAACPVLLGDVLFEFGGTLGYSELWFEVPGWERAKILKGRDSWQRFCERAAALEVKAAYEVAKQRIESNRQRSGG